MKSIYIFFLSSIYSLSIYAAHNTELEAIQKAITAQHLSTFFSYIEQKDITWLKQHKKSIKDSIDVAKLVMLGISPTTDLQTLSELHQEQVKPFNAMIEKLDYVLNCYKND